MAQEQPTARTAPRDEASAVVVLDDDPALAESMSDLLLAEGYAAEADTDPARVLARLKRAPTPRLLLLDCTMPAMTGEAFLTAMAEAGVRVPVVFCTALPDRSVRSERVAAVLHKPFELSVFFDVVRRFAGDPPRRMRERGTPI